MPARLPLLPFPHAVHEYAVRGDPYLDRYLHLDDLLQNPDGRFDSQKLLDRFDEELYLPAHLIALTHSKRFAGRAVRNEPNFSRFAVIEAQATSTLSNNPPSSKTAPGSTCGRKSCIPLATQRRPAWTPSLCEPSIQAYAQDESELRIAIPRANATPRRGAKPPSRVRRSDKPHELRQTTHQIKSPWVRSGVDTSVW